MDRKPVRYAGLLAEMARYGDTQGTIADLLDLSQGVISRRFNGETPWTIGEIETLCKHYEKSYEELFGSK